MHLANRDIWFWIVIFLIILIGLILRSLIRKNRLVNQIFSDVQKELLLSNFSPTLRMIRTILLILGLISVGFAILDPRWGSRTVERELKGIDLVIVTDISASMNSQDVSPSRLEYAKLLSQQLISLMLGNRIGLAAFAGYGFRVIPLTTDVNAIVMFLNELSTDLIDVQGSNLEDAIEEAILLFSKETLTHKAIVIFTDGEDIEFDPMKAARSAKELGITIFTVGIGTPQGGAIPLLDAQGNIVDYMKDEQDKLILSRLNESLLKQIAEETGGFFIHGDENSILHLAQRLDEIQKSKFGSNIFEFMEPQFQYFLLIGILLLLIYMLLPDRKLGTPKLIGKITVLLLILTVNKIYSSPASEGTKLYKAKDFQKALQEFQKAITINPNNLWLRYNEGNTYYQLSDFGKAASSYLKLTNTDKPDLYYRSLYNLGNSLAQLNDLGGALNAYKQILDTADPESEVYQRALNNFIYLKQRIQQQQQQQAQQQQQQQSQDQTNQQPQQQQESQTNQQSQQQKKQETKPISPTDIENLLNLIEAEEKKHLSKKQKQEGDIVYPKLKY